MPFISQDKRKVVDADLRLADEPGDLCYAIYMHLFTLFLAERRWKTVHRIYKHFVMDPAWAIETFKDTKWTRPDIVTALHMAWQVFFVKEVMVYEEEMIEKNGDIALIPGALPDAPVSQL